jgi:DNA helicase HerA-like ATPase
MTVTPPAGSFYSVDGRSFAGLVSLDSPLLVGDFVELDVPGNGRMLGQVLCKEVEGHAALASGALRASVGPDRSVGAVLPRPFADADLLRPDPEVLAAFHAQAGADLLVGTTISGSSEESPALLRHKGFSRHTFVCGQSGSGKTYALGVLLEQLLAETALPMILIDPNGDYVHLGETRAGADPGRAARLEGLDIRVLSVDPDHAEVNGERLAVKYAGLRTAAKASILRIDPLLDREEYNAHLRFLGDDVDPQDLATFFSHLESDAGKQSRAIAHRVQNLGLLGWQIWARGDSSVLDVVEERPRAVVMDVSGCAVPQERSVAALALLDHLWARREERNPVLLVIDEAHNLCTADPVDSIQAAVTERLVQIAAEGRKYGLWLVLSTQQPHKIHPNVLSQCDNLVLMRMNSAADLAHLGEVFGAAPPQMLAAATSFRQGEMLLAGGFVAAPMIARVAERLTVEGGSDVSVPLRHG